MVFDITVSRYDVGKCPHCGYWWSVWLCWCVSQRRCRPGLHSQSRIPQSAPEHGICRGDSRMTQLQEAIHNKITTYSEDE